MGNYVTNEMCVSYDVKTHTYTHLVHIHAVMQCSSTVGTVVQYQVQYICIESLGGPVFQKILNIKKKNVYFYKYKI